MAVEIVMELMMMMIMMMKEKNPPPWSGERKTERSI
jgi:hypothetical protein